MKYTPISPQQHLSHVIAVIGCDGSGKSTVTADLLAKLKNRSPMELIYLGQSSGSIGDWIKDLPIVGASFGRYLMRKAEKANDKKKTAPDNLTALVIYLLSKWRAHKFTRMLKLCNEGVIVITDRYPQAEVAGFNVDGTGLNTALAKTWLVQKLAAREQRMYQWMASYVPALVIRLNIDAETAHARKPDHKMPRLLAKIEVIPNLHFNQATILDLNSRDPYEKVLKTAMKATIAVIESSKGKPDSDKYE